MPISKSTKRIIIIAISIALYSFISSFFYHIDRYTRLSFFAFILMAICFIILIYFVIKGVFQIYKERRNLSFQVVFPSLFALAGLAYILLWPWNFNSENLLSDIEFQACYEGTQNQSYIKFREDHSFEINSTGILYNEWFSGQWRKNADTIFMDFDTKRPRLISNDTIIIKNEHLLPISDIDNDSLIYAKYYYLGYCKGLN
ncbi:MAG: hypothetical protein Q4G63_05895 [Bacteroidia bacterium]|nr:hypothetical protein [Bacteroidia bacterium]